MDYVALEKLLDKSGGSVYKLVVLASKRALELAEGQPKLVKDVNSATKPSTIALMEIMEGKVKVKG
jgi:DNA-directed RNA polymerase omega subunit